jgi:ubiquitin carboxyl-terminal hydrolase 2/21
MYFYQYLNKSFQIYGMIELFADEWKYIYNKHFSKKTFAQYLTEKNINLGLIGQKQSLLSSGKKYLGNIYLINKLGKQEKISENVTPSNITMNTGFNENITKNNNLKNIYQNFMNSLKSLVNNSYDLQNIETIMSYLSSGIINGISVFIIETSNLNYCLKGKKQLIETDIISSDNISESKKYSFINDAFCKYFKVQNIEYIPKVFLFVNKEINQKRNIFIYSKNQNCLLKVSNYINNSFNLTKISNSNNNIQQIINSGFTTSQPLSQSNHTLGLENIGATCYMNATLQCLCHVIQMKDYFLNDNIYNQDILTRDAPLAKCFAEVIRKLWSQTYETSYAPRSFKDKISEMNPLFQGIQANDSKDLVLFIYENIHRELNNPSQNTNDINFNNIPNELVQFRQNYYSQNYSIISKIFYYEQSSVMECQTCHFKTYNFNIMNIIIFPLEKVRLYMQKKFPNGFSIVTLDDCFDQNEQPELLFGANQIYCNNCRQNANALSYNKLYTCPEVLTIILNRGKGLEFDVNFSFPLNISIDKYVTEKTNDTNYELIGVLTHHGPSGMAGHFVAYCKSPIDNNWYFYNDAVVTPCQGNVESEMQSNGIPYILYYQRRQKGKYCIYFKCGEKEGFFEYNDNNMLLSEAYSKFREKYTGMPDSGRMMLLTENNMGDLDEYKSLKDNGIKDGDKISVIIE